MRQIVIIFMILVVGFCYSCRRYQKGKTPKHPNIIIILTDDQGWGDLSMNGNSDISTPNIDKLAKLGATFNQFYVSPVCSPTRAELLTGRYAVRGGVYSTSMGGERLDPDETTIAEVFKENGYKTAAYGKWHNGTQYPYHPNARGFDDFYGFCSGHWGNYFSPMMEHNGEIVKGDGYITDDLTNKAIEFIESNRSVPFFLYIPYNTPHSPMQVPDIWWNKFESKESGNSHRYNDQENVLHTKAAYAMCENIDWNVGRLIEKLKELDLMKKTIIVYLSDNGPNGWRWNGELKGIKGHTDEGGVRSPCIIQWKGMIDPGLKIPEIAGAIDLLPTLSELAGFQANTNKDLDGKSLGPLLFKSENTWDNRFIFSYWNGKISLRDQRFMLDEQNILFDLESDPGQFTDVSEVFPDTRNSMIIAKKHWEENVLSELEKEKINVFPIGHPDAIYTHLPARDGKPHGNIQRSNRWPNCSFFTNWHSIHDSITWDVEVLEEGDYEAILYYTCSKENIGSVVELRFGNYSIQKEIAKAHNPPLSGAENDRVIREESYVKDFLPLNIGTIHLEQEQGILSLKARKVAGEEVMDFRLLVLKKMRSE